MANRWETVETVLDFIFEDTGDAGQGRVRHPRRPAVGHLVVFGVPVCQKSSLMSIFMQIRVIFKGS